MSKSSTFGFDVITRKAPLTGRKEDMPFRILLMGDFSGHCSHEGAAGCGLSLRRVYRVDGENLDQIMGKIGVEIGLPLNGEENPPQMLRFSKLDDFHPDSLFNHSEVFGPYREARTGVKDSGFLPGAQGHVEKPMAPSHGVETLPESLVKAAIEDRAGLFQDLLEKPVGERSESGGRSNIDAALETFLKKIVSPHIDPDSEDRAVALRAVDTAAGAMMRAILHFPDFQAVEAAWRGLDYLISRVGEGDELQIHLLDVSLAALASDLRSTSNLAETATFRFLVEQTLGTPGARPWSLIAGLYTFECLGEDIDLLARIATIAEASGAPFIAQAGDSLIGCKSLLDTPNPKDWEKDSKDPGSAAWEAFRRLPRASWIGLAMPPFLLRLPYGAKTEPVESFRFEEFEGPPEHERYLWGNAAFFCACLIAQSFLEEGWDLRPGSILEASGFPVHTYMEDGESVSKPCAGVLITHTAAEAILDNAIMPLVSFRGQDRVSLGRLQSVANPARGLSGPWGE